MASPTGFRMWEKMVEEERELSRLRRETYKTPMEEWNRIVPGGNLAFDYKIWADFREFCIWHREDVRAYRLDEIADASPGNLEPGPDEVIRDYDVFGRR